MEEFVLTGKKLSDPALAAKQKLETDAEARRDYKLFFPEMEDIQSDLSERVLAEVLEYQPERYEAADVRRALQKDSCDIEDFKALLSPAAAPFLEDMAREASRLTARHFGTNVYLFTPLYISNYCENYCVYCGFNCFNPIQRMKLTPEEIEAEMKVIATSGMEEILILTGESRSFSSVEYIGEAVRLARKYFRNIGLEIYPVNTDEYRYLHNCGADYVTVFQETYDVERYQELHLLGHKRVWQYRFDSQERALRGGVRGVAFSALYGLSDYRKDALATGLHAYHLQRRYREAEISLSCPRLRPTLNNPDLCAEDVDERALTQILCAYRLFLPFAGITVSTRERQEFRNGIIRIAATKVSAGVSTGVGDHEEKYSEKSDKADHEKSSSTDPEITAETENKEKGDEQFDIADERSLGIMYEDIKDLGLDPVLNDYLYYEEEAEEAK